MLYQRCRFLAIIEGMIGVGVPGEGAERPSRGEGVRGSFEEIDV